MKNKIAKRSRFASRLIDSQIATTLQQVSSRDEAQFLLLVNQLRDSSCLLDYSTASGQVGMCGFVVLWFCGFVVLWFCGFVGLNMFYVAYSSYVMLGGTGWGTLLVVNRIRMT